VIDAGVMVSRHGPDFPAPCRRNSGYEDDLFVSPDRVAANLIYAGQRVA
jgi:hypothetical protein